ncbi:MAG: alkaline phosphatase D family protein [Nocardioidaceae bacterium]|nr:alkaline phosphatase D family protein [Nocardioidaceae bacterium]
MNDLPRRTFLRSSVAVGGAATLLGSSALLNRPSVRLASQVVGGRPSLTHGVQSGDVSRTGATVWARSDRPARLMVEVARDEHFRSPVRLRGPVTRFGTDLTGRIDLKGLPPGRELSYRIWADDPDGGRPGQPVVGRLRTAPSRREDVRFLWSGDIAGQGWGIDPAYGGYRIVDAMAARDADFFLCSGDTVYADGPLTEKVALPDGRTWTNLVTVEKSKVAESLHEFRGQYKYNLQADNWRRFLARTPQVNQWDDHEVTNNWYPGEILDDPRYQVKDVDTLARRAKQAFHEYVPINARQSDADGRIYRVIHHGPSLDVFVLDMRTYKDPNTANGETRADGGVLGRKQTRWLLKELAASKATWKVIAADLPLGLVVPDGTEQEGIAQGDPGMPRGRERDIAEVLTGIQRLGIRNHVWLTADVHYTAAHHYSPDRASYQRFDPFWEFVSGPLNAGSFGPNALDGTFGPKAVYVEAPPRQNTSPAEGFQFFGEVQIDGDTEELTVQLRGIDGAVRWQTSLTPSRR